MASIPFTCSMLLLFIAIINQLGICTCRPIITIDNNVQMERELFEDNYNDGLKKLVEGHLSMGGNDARMEISEVNRGLLKSVHDGDEEEGSAKYVENIDKEIKGMYNRERLTMARNDKENKVNYDGGIIVSMAIRNDTEIKDNYDRRRLDKSSDDKEMKVKSDREGLTIARNDKEIKVNYERGRLNMASDDKELKINYERERLDKASDNKKFKFNYEIRRLDKASDDREGLMGSNSKGTIQVDDDEEGVPALLVFGDSTVDAGTNKYLLTISRSDFTPYGRDLASKLPTGRFSNGLLVTDYLASMMGLHAYTVAYLDIKHRINQGIKLLEKPIEMEVSFASASSGIYDSTAIHFNALPLSKQLDHFKEYKDMLIEMLGKPKSLEILKRGIFILSTGTNDFLNNYMFNPYLRAKYTLEEFQSLILGLCAQFIQNLYVLGARRIGVVSLPPFGCLPAMMTLHMHTSIGCVEHLNKQAAEFNKRLQETMDLLETNLNGLELAYMDSYNVLFNVIHNPKEYGLKHTQKACCGSGKLEAGPFCNKLTLGTCEDATSFAFWDSFHSTDHMNQILALELFEQLWVELKIKEPYAYYCKHTIMNDVRLKA